MLTVERLTPDAWQLERSLRIAALTEAQWAFGTSLTEAENFTEADWRARLAAQARFAALVDGEPAGTAGFLLEADPYPELEAFIVGMWVAPSYRGSGVGAALVDVILQAVRQETDLGRVLLSVVAHNVPAIKRYERHGFRPVTLTVPPDEGEVYMERLLER